MRCLTDALESPFPQFNVEYFVNCMMTNKMQVTSFGGDDIGKGGGGVGGGVGK